MFKFDLKANETCVRTEVLAGITTFLSMVYILAVYPNVMSSIGIPAGGAVIAAALASFIGTFLMGWLGRYPFALAPGVGIVPFFAFSVVLSMGISWQFAMAAVFVEGLIFLACTLIPIREKIFDAIPLPLKTAIGVGIGLFIIYIGLQGARIIVGGPCLTTLVGFRANFGTSGLCAVLALAGLAATVVMHHHRIPGAMLWGILFTWGLGMLCQVLGIYRVDPAAKLYSLYPEFKLSTLGGAFREFRSLWGECLDVGKWSLNGSALSGWKLLLSGNFLIVMFTLLFDDLFNTLGTLTGVASTAGMLDKDGKLPRLKGALLADALATTAGALMGATTTTTYVESATGVAVGGRTGLSSYVTAILFLLAIFFAPVFTVIPAFATAPALIMVGFFMVSQIVNINFRDLAEAFPCFAAIIIMPFSYNIADGICFGFIFWTLVNLLCGRRDRVNPTLIVCSLLFVAKYIFL
jgi:AGZA family xanthine/uracil permease-like MFS transporter